MGGDVVSVGLVFVQGDGMLLQSGLCWSRHCVGVMVGWLLWSCCRWFERSEWGVKSIIVVYCHSKFCFDRNIMLR